MTSAHKIEMIDNASTNTKKTLQDKLFNSYGSLKTNKKIVGVSFVIILFTIIGVSFINLHQSRIKNENTSNKALITKLSEINNQLYEIENSSANRETNEKVKLIQKNIEESKALLTDVAKSSDIRSFEDKFDQFKNDISQKIDQTEKSIIENSGSKQYLEPSKLPFKLIAIDIVGSQPYVSVNFENHTTPLGVTDSLAGWQLVNADFDTKIAEFTNNKQQFIKVSLEG